MRCPSAELIAVISLLAAFTPQQAHAQSPPAPCAPLPGVDAVLDRPQRILVFGELYGTAEAPAAFAEIVCAASERGPVTVGVEWPGRTPEEVLGDKFSGYFGGYMRRPVETFMASDGGPDALRNFTDRLGTLYHDGRTSLAMVEMIVRLRNLRAAGANIRVVAFVDPIVPPRDAQPADLPALHEKGLADTLNSLPATQRLIVLVSALHARRESIDAAPPYDPMAMHLPAADTLTFEFETTGGQAWGCVRQCGAKDVRQTGVLPPGVWLHPMRTGGYDGAWSLGKVTASPRTPVPAVIPFREP